MTTDIHALCKHEITRRESELSALQKENAELKNMNNPHVVVGEPRRCVCGSYEGNAIRCTDVIRVLSQIEDYAQTQINPSLFIRKGDRNPPQPPTGEDIMLLVAVMKPLITKCN